MLLSRLRIPEFLLGYPRVVNRLVVVVCSLAAWECRQAEQGVKRTNVLRRVQRGVLALYWFVCPGQALIHPVQMAALNLKSPVDAFTWKGVDAVALVAMRELLGAMGMELSRAKSGMPTESSNVLLPAAAAQQLFRSACVFLQTPEDSEKQFGAVGWSMLRTVLLGYANMLQVEKGVPSSGAVGLLRSECEAFIPFAIGHYQLLNKAIKVINPADIAPHERSTEQGRPMQAAETSTQQVARITDQ